MDKSDSTVNNIGLKRIITDLLKMGVKKGDKLIFHCSLKSIGYVEGGADTLINALLNVVGEEGLIMMPTFTYSYEGNKGTLPYNKKKTSSQTGLVSDVFWRRSDAYRSDHPTHSVATIGKEAEKYVENHNEYTPPFGEDTPIHKLAKNGGLVLLIGVGHEANSTIHVAECLADLPFLHIKNKDTYGDYYLVERDDGSIERIPLSKKLSGCSKAFGRIENIKGIKEIQREGYIGNALCKLVNGNKLIELLVPILKKDPAFLLCEGVGECNCHRKRMMLVQRE
ncbi:MAG: AAC(3) family N-acetyltransferase [Firmicutes bacterium]|nr:AAC(3) family N-acetyltransferase [Bacillota bacterium]